MTLDREDTRLLDPTPPLRLDIDGARIECFAETAIASADDGLAVEGLLEGAPVEARWTARRIAPGLDAWEFALTLRSASAGPVTITRMDPFAGRLAGDVWSTTAFRSAWGDEFRPEHGRTDSDRRFETRSGRSAHGYDPVVVLERRGACLVVAPAWSGNWHVDIAERATVTAGISDWMFETVLEPGEEIVAPPVVVAVGSELDETAAILTAAVARGWLPRSPASDRLDVEWNHWWPYEDAEVDEGVIAANADLASALGVGVVTVDAGWFGPSEADSLWSRHRGDWHLANAERFPSGLGSLGDRIRRAGARPGIWIEAEAVGSDATVRRDRPDILAIASRERRPDPSYRSMTESSDPDDPGFLGYVCCGSEAGRRFVFESLDRAVRTMGAEWVKLDFNVDPDAGCTRTDHGHGAGDGLFRHYTGLYAVLDAFRRAHPEVIVEACSSGGLRLDLGLARHVHCIFLSDPDYTEHALQVLWGASLVLPPAAMLHWSWSQWRGDHPPSRLDFATLGADEFATTLRAAMMHRFGVSLRLPELRDDLRAVLERHVEVYREHLVPLVRKGVLHRLTGQPERGGYGVRAPGFQLSAADSHAVFAFRLGGTEGEAVVHPSGLDPARRYRVRDPFAASERIATGSELARSGIRVPDRTEPSSVLVLIDPERAPSRRA